MKAGIKRSFTLFSLILIALSGFQSCVNDDEPESYIRIGDSLPQFSVTLNNGETVSTSNLKGKVGVVLFFNTECPDCQKELPVVQQLWEIYKDDAQVVIAPIAREESEDDILKYWGENNLTLPFSPQNNRKIYSLFASSGIPRIYVSNPETRVTFLSDDTDLPSLEKLIQEINRLRP